MKQLFNYCYIPGYNDKSLITKDAIQAQSYLYSLGLDGIELFHYKKDSDVISAPVFPTVGVHLKYWPYWLDFWHGNKQCLKKQFANVEELQKYFFGAANKEEWINAIKENIKNALSANPEYLVWHVSDADTENIFTFSFNHTDEEVITATAEVFNAVSEIIPQNVMVLFENLWWPGLRLTNKKIVDTFFALLKRDNVGIMLDTGHLMNTNPALNNEEEAADYLCQTIENLGTAKELIYGIHLSSSISGEYVGSFERSVPASINPEKIMQHIAQIDRHQAWTSSKIKDLFNIVEPRYVVHELYYNDFQDLARLVRRQQTAIGII